MFTPSTMRDDDYYMAMAQTNIQDKQPVPLTEKPEILLAKCFRDDLGVDINPQALRMFIRARWDRISCLGHKIHEGG